MPVPLVSVVIPAYNCERFIADSMRSALNQTLTGMEVIVIDDASSDGTYAVAAEMAARDSRIRLYQNKENSGVAQTRNRGFDLAAGKYVAFLDGDDLWLPDKLRLQAAMLELTASDFCYTSYLMVDERGNACGKPYLVPPATSLGQMLLENVVGCSTVLCRAELLKKYRMRPEYAHEDYVLWLELLQAGYKACGITQPLMRYRVLRSSRSGDKKRAARGRWQIYRRFMHMNILQSGRAFLRYGLSGICKHYTK